MALAVFGAVLVVAVTGLEPFGHYPGPYGDLVARIVPTHRQATALVSALTFDVRGFDTLGEEFILFAAVCEQYDERRPGVVLYDRLAGRHANLRGQQAQRYLEGGPHLSGRQVQALGEGGQHLPAASGSAVSPVGVVDHGSASSSPSVHSGMPSVRQISPICQRGNGSPGYHLPWLRCTRPSGATLLPGPPSRGPFPLVRAVGVGGPLGST